MINTSSLIIPDPERPVQFATRQITVLDAEVDSLIQVLKARQAFSVTGSGLTVAVLDTGLRTTHVDFSGRVRAQRNFTTDSGGDPNNASDGHGHGTNVGGIIAANGIHKGIAPSAGIIPLKVLRNTGGGDFGAVEKALRWVLDNRATHNISVVSMSLGADGNDQDDAAFEGSETQKLIAALREFRIPVVIAAGNSYFKYQSEGMGFPAILRQSVSVGAVYDAKEGGFTYGDGATAHSTTPDQITPFSQRLSYQTNPLTRTDILAPGAPVTSSGNESDQGESVQHGTSQATPVVSGVLLLVQEYFLRETGQLPTVDLLVECIRAGGATVIDDGEDDNVSHTKKRFPRVDALGALNATRRVLQKHLLLEKTPFYSTAPESQRGQMTVSSKLLNRIA
jgi:subtilisin family serine protease